MSDLLSFYLDGTVVQAVKVRIIGKSVTVLDAVTLTTGGLADYLSVCEEKSCVVCCNPQSFYQDIVHLPPAAGKHYGKLIRGKIQSAHPDLTQFSFFHCTIGETMIDTKAYSKIAAFSYPDDFLSRLIFELNRFDIGISKVYAAPYAIFKLAASLYTSDPDQSRIFIAALPGEKLHLVSENNELAFIRKTPSSESALLLEDANNINMTVDYSFQALRIRPVEAVMLNQAKWSEHLAPTISVPFKSGLLPQLTDLPLNIIQDYLAPVAAAIHSVESPRIGNMVPSSYLTFIMQKMLFKFITIMMLILTVLFAGYLVAEQKAVFALKAKNGRIRTELSGSANELATFRKLDAEVTRLKQPLEFANKHNSLLNPAKALAALELPKSREYTIRGVTVQTGEGSVNVQFEGAITASSFGDTQALYERLVAHVGTLAGYSVLSSKVDIKQKTFSIQARYNGGGARGK
jgi:hypothetical protein